MTTCTAQRAVHPAVRIDVQETPEAVTLEIPAPGVASDGVSIHVENGVLSITAERKKEEGETKVLHRERRAGAINKRYTLPKWVDASQISANLADGLLTITLPKASWAQRRVVPVN